MNAQHRLGRLVLVIGAAFCSSAASATLIIEPVFNRVAGSGPEADGSVIGFYIPDFINPATGEPFLTADEPGEVITYPAGYPADPVLTDSLRFFNNTEFAINGFVLSIVGTAVEPEPFNFTVARDPSVDAMFGDVNGDGMVGQSDIFSTITVSNDGRTIRFSDGVIPIGERFTDFNLSTTTDGQPFLAAFDASFTAVPEPETLALLAAGFLGLVLCRRATSCCSAASSAGRGGSTPNLPTLATWCSPSNNP